MAVKGVKKFNPGCDGNPFDWMSISQFASMHNVSKMTVINWINSYKLEARSFKGLTLVREKSVEINQS